MSIKAMNQVWESNEFSERTDKFLLLAIADCANQDGIAWPSVPHLADKTMQHRATAYRSIHRLVEQGHIETWKEDDRRFYRILSQEERDEFIESQSHHATLKESEESHHATDVSHHATTESRDANPLTNEPSVEPSVEPKGYFSENGSDELFEFETVQASKPAELFTKFLDPHRQTTDAMLALGQFERDRRERRKKMTTLAIQKLCRKINSEDWSSEEITLAVSNAIERSWTTLYRPSPPSTQQKAAQSEAAPSQPQDYSAWNKGKKS